MNPPATQSQPDPLDHITLAVMIRATMDSLPHPPDASADEQDAQRHAAFTIISTLRPRDVLEAMLAARIAATQFHIMDDLRCAAQRDLAPNLKLRHRSSATALTRMMEAARRELTRLQAFLARQPAALPASIPAARVQPALGTAPDASAQLAAPVSWQAAGHRPAAAAAPRPATGRFAVPTDAEVAQLVAEVEAIQAERDRPAVDAHERLQAEVASRAAASAVALAA
jgi:hypothetical protein